LPYPFKFEYGGLVVEYTVYIINKLTHVQRAQTIVIPVLNTVASALPRTNSTPMLPVELGRKLGGGNMGSWGNGWSSIGINYNTRFFIFI
jgi:hypothetical protein